MITYLLLISAMISSLLPMYPLDELIIDCVGVITVMLLIDVILTRYIGER